MTDKCNRKGTALALSKAWENSLNWALTQKEKDGRVGERRRRRRKRRRKERRGEECADQNSNCRFLIKLSSSQEFTFLAPKHSLVAVNLLKMESE